MATFVCGCALFAVNESRDYYDTLNQWTKSQRIYEGLESRLYVHATYKSMVWRKAYIDEYARRYRLSEDLKEAMLFRELEIYRLYNEFFISAYTPTDEWNDFDKKDSIWKLYLTDEVTGRLDAVEIKKIDSKDPLHREFFPFLDAWSSGYVVRFPRYDSKGAGPVGEDESNALTLIIGGVKGRGELKWQLNPDSER